MANIRSDFEMIEVVDRVDEKGTFELEGTLLAGQSCEILSQSLE